jgi:hypothetical protein
MRIRDCGNELTEPLPRIGSKRYMAAHVLQHICIYSTVGVAVTVEQLGKFRLTLEPIRPSPSNGILRQDHVRNTTLVGTYGFLYGELNYLLWGMSRAKSMFVDLNSACCPGIRVSRSVCCMCTAVAWCSPTSWSSECRRRGAARHVGGCVLNELLRCLRPCLPTAELHVELLRVVTVEFVCMQLGLLFPCT